MAGPAQRGGNTPGAFLGGWILLLGQLDGMLDSKPGDLAAVAAAHVQLIIAMDELRLLIWQLREAKIS